MGFNKRYVPGVSVLKEQLKQEGLKSFVDRYTKPDALIGDADGMVYISKQIAKLSKLEKEKPTE